MRRVAALLAVALLGAAVSGCGGGGAEPGAPEGATLVLDFQPNAVHSGIYAAQANGDFKDAGIDLHIQEPSSTADSAKLLAAGRADFAVMDINDFGIARERGLDLVAIAAIVQRPLASVIARNPNEIRSSCRSRGQDDRRHRRPLRRRRARHRASLRRRRSVLGAPGHDRLQRGRRSGRRTRSTPPPVSGTRRAWSCSSAGSRSASSASTSSALRGTQSWWWPTTPTNLLARMPSLRRASRAATGFLGQHPDQALGRPAPRGQRLDRGSQQAQLDALTAADAFSHAAGRHRPRRSHPRQRRSGWLGDRARADRRRRRSSRPGRLRRLL